MGINPCTFQNIMYLNLSNIVLDQHQDQSAIFGYKFGSMILCMSLGLDRRKCPLEPDPGGRALSLGDLRYPPSGLLSHLLPKPLEIARGHGYPSLEPYRSIYLDV